MEDLNYKRFMRDLKQHPLVLFTGAGINGGLVPQWPNLLSSLLRKVNKELYFQENYKTIDFKVINRIMNSKVYRNMDQYTQATFIKLILDKRYKTFLQGVLYKEFSFNNLEEAIEKGTKPEYNPLIETARLSMKNQIKAVVTYNFDNLLEHTITKIGLKTRQKAISISDLGISDIDDGQTIRVYHVHGMIPAPDSRIRASMKNIVFSRDEYFQNMFEPYSWQTTTQLYFLMNYMVLFIGTSLNDWNMLRMLSFANKYAPLKLWYFLKPISKDQSVPEEVKPDPINSTYSTIYESVGLRPIYVNVSKNNFDPLWEKVAEITKELGKKRRIRKGDGLA